MDDAIQNSYILGVVKTWVNEEGNSRWLLDKWFRRGRFRKLSLFRGSSEIAQWNRQELHLKSIFSYISPVLMTRGGFQYQIKRIKESLYYKKRYSLSAIQRNYTKVLTYAHMRPFGLTRLNWEFQALTWFTVNYKKKSSNAAYSIFRGILQLSNFSKFNF